MAVKRYLGIDLGGTNVAMGILDEDYHILAKKSIPTDSSRGFEKVVEDIALTAKAFAWEEQGVELDWVGVGVPSTVNPHTKRMVFANNLGWVDVDFVTQFRRHWDVPLHIANDACCAVLGEAKAGCGVGQADMLMLTLGTGVGGGIILNHQLFLGGNGMGCELGHTLFQYDGIPCNCGRSGCLEMYLSVTAFKKQTRAAMARHPDSVMHQLVGRNADKVSGKTAFQAKALGDRAGTEVVDCYTGYIASGIVSLYAHFRSPLVIIGGGISNEGEPLLAPVRQRVGEVVRTTDFMEPPQIVKAQLGNDAGIIGAALLGLK